MRFRFLLTAIVLAVVLYIQFFFDFKTAINSEADADVQDTQALEVNEP
jgi:hypothetical protein